ncbi:cytochrome c [Pedobacter sp. UYEF25]
MKNISVFLFSIIALTLLYFFRMSNYFAAPSRSNDAKLELKIDTPDQDRFVKTTLVQGKFTEPTEIAVLPNYDVLVAQRRGEVLLYKNQTKMMSQVGKLDVYWKTTVPNVNAEEGLLGIAADPQFSTNQFIYLFYSPTSKSVNRLSRFKMIDDKIDLSSEKIVLEFYSQRDICCHTGGSIAFGKDNMLFVSAGDNSTPFDQENSTYKTNAYAPLDARKGFEQYDSRRSAGNTNDLRGKILRIKMNADGTYSIPEGNLFPKGTAKTRPEIYVMGDRNPYRIAVDKTTGYLYWGEVGPDANNDDSTRGPRGYDEVNQAKKAGNFGWPLIIGNNYPYRAYDYTTGKSGAYFDPARPINNSPNNTGLTELPAAQPAFIWYPYGESKEFPQLGSGGRTAMAGPVYYSKPGASPYPNYYDGKLLIYDWVRGWVKAVTMGSNGDYVSMEPFMGNMSLSAPIDMEQGPDGKLYILEYGKGWFASNPDAALVRVDYLKGNRPPVVSDFSISKTAGSLPYKLTATVKAKDPDGDALMYVWNLGNGIKKTTTIPSFSYTYTKVGEYPVSVTVIDPLKASAKSNTIPVFAGNEYPNVAIDVVGNKSFYFANNPINYNVVVSDKGAIVDKTKIYLSKSYVEGFDLAGAQLGHQQAATAMVGKAMIAKLDCGTCHKEATTSIGPAFIKVAQKYKGDANAVDYLTNKIKKGGAGVWGEVPMPAHPTTKDSDLKEIAKWILSLDEQKSVAASLPLKGQLLTDVPSNKKNTVLSLKASYTDNGASGLRPLSTTYELNLRNSTIAASDIKDFSNFDVKEMQQSQVLELSKTSGWLKLKNIDLTNIKAINIDFENDVDRSMQTEIRLDDVNGKLVGSSTGQIVNLNKITDGKYHNLFIVFTQLSKNDAKPKLMVKALRFESL